MFEDLIIGGWGDPMLEGGSSQCLRVMGPNVGGKGVQHLKVMGPNVGGWWVPMLEGSSIGGWGVQCWRGWGHNIRGMGIPTFWSLGGTTQNILVTHHNFAKKTFGLATFYTFLH